MEEYDIRGRLIAQAYFSELEKIAAADPMEIAQAIRGFESTAKAAKPDLIQKLKPGTGSLFGAIKDRLGIAKEVRGVRSQGRQAFDAAKQKAFAEMKAAQDVFGKHKAMHDLARIREAESHLHGGAASPGGFFASKGGAPTAPNHSALRNVLFGAGIGAAGLAVGQHYLNSRNSDQYPSGY